MVCLCVFSHFQQMFVGNVDETRKPETCVHCGTGTDNLIILNSRRTEVNQSRHFQEDIVR